MLFINFFIDLIILPIGFGSIPNTLYLTDWIDVNTIPNGLQHDCLHVPVSTLNSDPHEMISYCMSEWPSKWQITNRLDPNFTFAELYQRNITSEQLYYWSAPMDIAENYQHYLNDLSHSGGSSPMENDLFYNCTSPRFGPLCQYEFDSDQSMNSSIIEIINEYYRQPYQPKTLTCYVHLKCSVFLSPICIDWTDVCDGKYDCYSGYDEQNCEVLINNQCENPDDEYRCDNGQCISKTFVNDPMSHFECLDRSDEHRLKFLSRPYASLPTMQTEDITCSWHSYVLQDRILTSSCVEERQLLMKEKIFSKPSHSMSNDCFIALKCHLNILSDKNPLCTNTCKNELCIELINNDCPSLFSLPDFPIAYGHIYLIYTKEYIINSTNLKEIPPEHICYDHLICKRFRLNEANIIFDGKLCQPPENLPIFFDDQKTDWYDRYIKPTYLQLIRCNNIRLNKPAICNNITQYQCQNSSKCIPKLYIDDGLSDCQYGDDEEASIIVEQCSTDQLNLFFKCPTSHQCIHRNRVNDGICDCVVHENGICADELFEISERFSTDCDQWPCKNFDKTNFKSSLLNCSLNHYLCVSFLTYQLICLPIEKMNDGIIDCLGSTDEPNLCSEIDYPSKEKGFYCKMANLTTCLNSRNLCDGIKNCDNGDDEYFCTHYSDLGLFGDLDENTSDAEEYFRSYFQTDLNLNSAIEKSQSDILIRSNDQCHRGIPLRVYLNDEKDLSIITCLCPPSYYGDHCQFQNQRVSLTIELSTPSYYSSMPFVLVVSLIDDSSERIIHSYVQLTYLLIKGKKKRFNCYLLYSKRPKDSTKQYAVQIDIFERASLDFRGSLLIPIKFPFLPVERIAVKVNIPSADAIMKTCSNSQCVYGRCIHYLNNPKQDYFCQCHAGWTGMYCHIPYTCTCSKDSLCLGIAANNRSICVCPLQKFGSRCQLANNICQSNPCQNGGYCLSSDPYVCICPKGFSGDQCQLIDTRIIVSLEKDIGLLSTSVVAFHFIHVSDTTKIKQGYNLEILCENDTSVETYWSQRFHLAFAKLSPDRYYFIYHQQIDQQLRFINQTIHSADRCPSISEILDQSIVDMPSIKRIKFYDSLCRNRSLNLSCFYDERYMCLCNDQYSSQCFEFNHQINTDELNFYNNRSQIKCSSKYLSSSTTSSFSSTSTFLLTSTTTRFQENNASSISACEYLPYLFMLFFCLHIHYTQ